MPIYSPYQVIERIIKPEDIDMKTLFKLKKIASKVRNEYIKDHRKLKEYILSLFKTAVVKGESIGKLNELLLKEDPDYVHEHKHQYRFGNSIKLNMTSALDIASYDIFDSNGLDNNLYTCMMMEFINKCNEELKSPKYRFDIFGNYNKGRIVIVVKNE